MTRRRPRSAGGASGGADARGQGTLRRSQVITTYGPGALIDLPRHSAIVGGLETWPARSDLQQIHEPRLAARLQQTTEGPPPGLYAPPAASDDPRDHRVLGIRAWRFPEWFVVQEAGAGRGADGSEPRRRRSRRLVHRTALDERGRYERRPVVATRFVRACPKGHVDDIDWYRFVHGADDPCRNQLWLDEGGTSGDLSDLVVRCDCGQRRGLHKAMKIDERPLGDCDGARPWLGRHAREDCAQPARLLIRTASNAWFPQVMSVLSLPDDGAAVDGAVTALWDDLQYVNDANSLGVMRRKPAVDEGLAGFSEAEILDAIRRRSAGGGGERSFKQVELDALLAAPKGLGDAPADDDFQAQRLRDEDWRRGADSVAEGVAAVVQLHRLREVMALAGFTRFEAAMPGIDGEYDSDVERAEIALDPSWFPAVENRGEGIFLQLDPAAVEHWRARPGVRARIGALEAGHERWDEQHRAQHRRKKARPFPGGPYVLLHTLAHLLIQSLAVRCGYPAASIRERIYVDAAARRYGLLLYTASADAEGTLGGLVQQARSIEDHLAEALRAAALCSNDPVCAAHDAGRSLEQRWLHGAACHGCALVAETSCEMRNDYLDRALVVPVIETPDAAFFRPETP